MSAFTVAAVVASLDGADWLPPFLHWEIATTDGVWGAHAGIDAQSEAQAYRLMEPLAELHASKLADDGRLIAVDFAVDEVSFRFWWLRPIERYIVPEQCATCPTKLGAPDVSFVRLGAGREAPVVCVPCRDRMHRRWVGGDAARDAEVLSEAAEAADCLTREDSPNITTTLESAWYDGADAAVQLLHRMADEAGKPVTTEAEPADACDRCRQPFDPSDARFDGRARHLYSPFCRRCVDRCHESTDAFHKCPVCAPAEGGDSRG